MERNTVIKRVGAFFRKLGGLFRRKAAPAPVQEEPRPVTEADGVSMSEPPCVRRIRRVMSASKVRKRRGGVSGIWQARAQDYSDAYRFLLILCDPSLVKMERRGGHVCHKAVFPDGAGSILLSEKVGVRRDALAVMRLNVDGLPDVREIRFCTRNRP